MASLTPEYDQKLPVNTSTAYNIDDSTKIKVLVVDDDTSLLKLAEIYLENEDDRLVIETSTSAADALHKLTGETFDVIVSDYLMPGMDGLEFLEQLRSKKNTVPFILFTGSGMEEVVNQALNLGANRYIQKGNDPGSQYSILARAIISEVEQ
ncbi:MAG: response regulator [Candidatus Odinarchaeota archaeon]